MGAPRPLCQERKKSDAGGLIQAVWSEATAWKKKPLRPRGQEGCVWLELKKLYCCGGFWAGGSVVVG